MSYKMRKPLVKNKYNLTIKQLKKYKVADRTHVGLPFFWRNNVIQAWCISGSAGTDKDCQFGTDDGFWIGIYDEDAKANALPVRKKKDWKNILDFANTEYINKDKCQYIKELDLLVLVVDPDLLGELTAVEESQIKRLINIRLHGNGAAMQMCRSVCFKCQIHSANHIIYAGMYDLENSVSVSSVMVYNSRISQSMSDDEDQQYTNLWNFAQQLYHENFS